MKIDCVKCSVSFPSDRKNRRFCSSSCAASFNNAGKRKNPPIERHCNTCSAVFFRTKSHRSINLCEKCFLDYEERKWFYRNKTIKEYVELASVKGKHPSWRNSHIRLFARAWNSSIRTHPCQKCGYSNHVELCHIKPITSFPETATIGEVNAAENLLVLCRNCHWEFDNGLLVLSDVPERKFVA